MCRHHEPLPKADLPTRRRFLQLAGASAGALLLSAVTPEQMAYAAEPMTPKPQNALDPEQALERLMAGNRRYMEGVTKRHDFQAEREALAEGQNPFAAVLGCADSRIAPEYAFDTGRGDLFAVRVAGNFVTDGGLASLEYAVAVLGTPLLMVLGHGSCGAVSAGVKALKDDAEFPGKIQGLADAIKPSVEKVLEAPGDLLDNAIVQNVKDAVSNLTAESPLLANAVAEGKLRIVGGVYKLRSGEVELVA
jgi:carbonic anhydrase